MITATAKGGYKWQLQTTVEVRTPIVGHGVYEGFFTLEPGGVLVIESGYAWDGASGPVRDTAKTLGPSLVHDAFYQMMRAGKLPQSKRRTVDRLFGAHCRELGTSRWKARSYVVGLMLWGGKHAKPGARRKPVAFPMPGAD